MVAGPAALTTMLFSIRIWSGKASVTMLFPPMLSTTVLLTKYGPREPRGTEKLAAAPSMLEFPTIRFCTIDASDPL
jgi:hypothetical protein